MPKLRVSAAYRDVLANKDGNGKQTREYVREKLRSAIWLIKSIHQRQRTIVRVMESIIRFQRELLRQGAGAPAAAEPARRGRRHRHARVDRARASRPTSTRRRRTALFELKFFFNSSIRTVGRRRDRLGVGEREDPADHQGRGPAQSALGPEDRRAALRTRASRSRAGPSPSTARRCAFCLRRGASRSARFAAAAGGVGKMKLTDILVRDACRVDLRGADQARGAARAGRRAGARRCPASTRPSSTRC